MSHELRVRRMRLARARLAETLALRRAAGRTEPMRSPVLLKRSRPT